MKKCAILITICLITFALSGCEGHSDGGFTCCFNTLSSNPFNIG